MNGQADQRDHLDLIDGLRALAVGLVILFHSELMDAGWTGVWVFFVISGFVITRSLTRYPPGASFGQNIRLFYAKRVRRILPLYLCIVAFGVLLIVWGAAAGQARLTLLDHVPWLLTGTYNFYRMIPSHEGTYLFGHLWSLSVEEQFYLVFPLLFFLLGRGTLVRVLVAMLVLAPLLRYAVGEIVLRSGLPPEQAGNNVYQFSVGHFDAFAAGCLMALFEARVLASRWLVGTVLGLLGFTLAAYAAMLLAAQATTAPGLAGIGRLLAAGFPVNVFAPGSSVLAYACVDLAAVLLLLLCLRQHRLAVLLFGTAAMRYLGRISYGIYIFHLPLQLVYWRVLERLAGPIERAASPVYLAGFAVYLCLLTLIAHLSFRYFEQRFIARARR